MPTTGRVPGPLRCRHRWLLSAGPQPSLPCPSRPQPGRCDTSLPNSLPGRSGVENTTVPPATVLGAPSGSPRQLSRCHVAGAAVDQLDGPPCTTSSLRTPVVTTLGRARRQRCCQPRTEALLSPRSQQICARGWHRSTVARSERRRAGAGGNQEDEFDLCSTQRPLGARVRPCSHQSVRRPRSILGPAVVRSLGAGLLAWNHLQWTPHLTAVSPGL